MKTGQPEEKDDDAWRMMTWEIMLSMGDQCYASCMTHDDVGDLAINGRSMLCVMHNAWWRGRSCYQWEINAMRHAWRMMTWEIMLSMGDQFYASCMTHDDVGDHAINGRSMLCVMHDDVGDHAINGRSMLCVMHDAWWRGRSCYQWEINAMRHAWRHDDVGDGMTQNSRVVFCSNQIQTQKGSNERLFILKQTHCKILFQIFVLINSFLLNLLCVWRRDTPGYILICPRHKKDNDQHLWIFGGWGATFLRPMYLSQEKNPAWFYVHSSRTRDSVNKTKPTFCFWSV